MVTILIALSLSMDAFSLSLAYGMLGISKKNIRTLSLIVGIYHFIMPILGMLIGKFIIEILLLKPNILVFIVLTIIGINMIIETFKEEKIHNLTYLEMLLFGLAVSLDSFSVGIGIKSITNNYIYTAFIFMLSSLIFTYIGLTFGKKLKKIIGKISTIIGGIILIIIGIIYL